MRVRLVRRDGDKATLLVTPSWIAKVFGARPHLVRCERLKCYSVEGLRDELFGGVEGFRWVIALTHRGVSVVMLEALEREEIEPLPKAEVQL